MAQACAIVRFRPIGTNIGLNTNITINIAHLWYPSNILIYSPTVEFLADGVGGGGCIKSYRLVV